METEITRQPLTTPNRLRISSFLFIFVVHLFSFIFMINRRVFSGRAFGSRSTGGKVSSSMTIVVMMNNSRAIGDKTIFLLRENICTLRPVPSKILLNNLVTL